MIIVKGSDCGHEFNFLRLIPYRLNEGEILARGSGNVKRREPFPYK